MFELKDGGRDVEDYLGSGSASELIEARNDFCTSLTHVMGKVLPGASERTEGLPEPSENRLGLRKLTGRASRKRGFGTS